MSEEVARAETPRGEVVLRRHRDQQGPGVWELRVNGVFVMDSQETSTEIELARAVLAQVDDPRDVVVGGLGLGFTLRAVLADPRVRHATVVEIEEPLIGWMRDGTIPHGPALLADDRVRVVNADLAMAVAEARSTYDVVLLDVDNGPGYLVHESNGSLYEPPFLARVRDLLRPGGALAVWSSAPSASLEAALGDALDDVETLELPVALQGRDEHYLLYLGRRLP